MFCLLEGPCGVIADVEDLNMYPKSVQEVVSRAIAFFGTYDYRNLTLRLGPDFSVPLLLQLINTREIECREFQINPVGNEGTYRIVSPDSYPNEFVKLDFTPDNVALSHYFDRD